MPDHEPEVEMVTCERCGKRKPVGSCACGGEGNGERLVPDGWDPELTRAAVRLPMTMRPASGR